MMATHRHDPISDLLKTHAPAFEEVCFREVTEIKRLLLDYIKTIERMRPASGPAPATDKKNNVGRNEHGFPVLPASFTPKTCTKIVLEKMYQEYLSAHYCMCNLYVKIVIVDRGIRYCNRQQEFTRPIW